MLGQSSSSTGTTSCVATRAKLKYGLSSVAFSLCLRVVVFDADLLFTDGAPELDGKLGNILFVALHALNGEAKQSLLHVEPHLIVVQSHDTVQAAISTLLDSRIIGLCGFADDLHDVVALALILEVGPNKLEGVAKSGDGSNADVVVGLLFSCALNNCCEDGIRMLCEAVSKILVFSLADEADSSEGGLFRLI